MIPGHRYENIDALRGIAAMLVVILHGAEVFAALPGIEQRGLWLRDVTHFLDTGRIGVVAFFLISGFVIPPTLRSPTAAGLRRFLVRRAFRLFPAYWLSIPLAYFALWYLQGREFTAADVIANATMIPTAFGREGAMGLYWTLETELAFYFLCCALFIAGLLHRPAALLGVQVVLLAWVAVQQAGLVPSPVEPHLKLVPYHLAIMIGGGLCRHAFDTMARASSTPRERRTSLLFATVAMGLSMVPVIARLLAAKAGLMKDTAQIETMLIAYSIGIAGFVLTVAYLRRPPAALVWMGTVSYSLYLLHPVPLYLMFRVLQDVAIPAPVGIGTLVLVMSAACLAVSALSYRYVELPAINYARRLTS